ncbi:spondin domain-containing protein [Dyadobacter fanqingshengii]|uniref:Spondin domain-containing protein n=1 Tax=Dyadobacter fanqingshengii TaxID=2906443 RepID=A0A9X1TB37_9BACT|nr:spondin domain-containing protein [Dyadobacter fanqingshengii]MCF0042138.1 spondin domain-containing protein [Dyadobacter fanqingshengii]USJ35328.1 spondin domain-containing protein [Dyadobacter fanqingshengii]
MIKPLLGLSLTALIFSSCTKDHDPQPQPRTISIENVLDSKPLVQSGTFKGAGAPPVILPGQSISFSFSASKNQRLTFATMYGWSNDLFFAPENPGIRLYGDDGTPITGEISSKIKLWDNGTRVNGKPGMALVHPGTAEAAKRNIKEVNGMDDYGHAFLPASQLMKVSLNYDGSSMFTVTIKNQSGGTANETPFSPGNWAISYVAGNDLLLPEPIYSKDKATTEALTRIAEAGDNGPMSAMLTGLTGIFTPLSPILVIVYNGSENPFFKSGENDRGEGLKELAQKGNADMLAKALTGKGGVKNVYVLKEPNSTVLLPKIGGNPGGKVSQSLSLMPGDRIAIATMYGFSNDWFFAPKGNGIDGSTTGDVSSSIGLYDNGTAIDQFPGAGITQFNLAGTPLAESKAIALVPNPNQFTTLPAIGSMIKVTLQ